MVPATPMQRALQLAREAPYSTSPNPTVGAVVISDGVVVGEGVTEPPPGRHAEVVALDKAGDKARGGTMYVTLEPCSHQGRTPPCTDAIVSAGLSEVHYAIPDPDPNVSGKGHRTLEALGIHVVSGDDALEASQVNEAYLKHRTTAMPFVIAKFAASLDGRISSASGDSRWVSGPKAREWSHRLRARIDAILVGSSTILVDDPQLTARPDEAETERQPLRVIVDTRGRTPPMARVFSGPGKTLVATAADAPAQWVASIEAAGAEVLTLDKHGEHVDLKLLLEELGRRDIVHLLVEGGGMVLGAFFDRGLVDKVQAIIAPVIVGASDAHTAIEGKGAYRMADALRLRAITIERLGDDILVTGYPSYDSAPS